MSVRRLALLLVCAVAAPAAFPGEVPLEAPARRSELTVYPTSRWPRERQVLPGEWMLISSQRGLWMPHVYLGESTLYFRKRGAEVLVIRQNQKATEELAGVRLGSESGRMEIRSAIAAGISPLTIWCYPSGVASLPALPDGRYYALSVDGVDDLKPLAELRQLSALKLGCTQAVTDLSPLARLTSLESLWLSGANAADLTPLASLSRLRLLRLDFCRQIGDLAPLAKLKDLRLLDLDGSEKVTDLRPLAELPRLSILVVRRCPRLLDLAPLAQFAELSSVGFLDCPLVADLTPLKSLPRLAAVELNGCPNLRDLSPLAAVPSIEAVSLQACAELADLSPLATLTRLKQLEVLDCPKVSSLWPMRRAGRQPASFSVDWRMRDQLAAVQQAAPSKVTLLMDGRYVSSVPMPPEALGENDGWGSFLGRSVTPAPGLGLSCGQLPYPAAQHKPGSVLNFSLEGARVFLAQEQGPRRLIGIVACAPLGFEALRQAIADGTSPLLIWSNAASIPALPPLPAGRDYTLVVLGLRAPLDPVARVRNLSGLYLDHAGAASSTLRPLARLADLKTLALPGSPAVDSLRYVARMTQLTSLDLTLSASVRDLSPLARLTQLKSLRLACARQMDFAPLASLPNLTQLTLKVAAPCTDLSSLGKLANLRGLSLCWKAAPASLAFVRDLPHLEALRLCDVAGMTDLAPLTAHGGLEVVILRSCRGLQDLRALATLPDLRRVDIAGCDKAGDVLTLERLRQRGVQLILDSRLLGLLPHIRAEAPPPPPAPASVAAKH